LGNALTDATFVRFTRVPFKADRVWRRLAAAKQS
jgi:CO/xanthine dehydrogenase Mo-binding subunit